jgi:Zn-dependent protease
MPGTLRFRLLGIPVEVQLTFWIATVVLASERLFAPHLLVMWVAVVFGSILLHEVGHALAFRRLGHRPEIVLSMMGGQAQAASIGRMNPTAEMLVALCGPIAGFTIGMPFLVVSTIFPGILTVPVLGTFVGDMVWVNIGWGLLNLLPIHPLDGGHVLLAWLRKRDVKLPTARLHQVSTGVAGFIAVIAVLVGQPFIATGAGALAFYNFLLARRA